MKNDTDNNHSRHNGFNGEIKSALAEFFNDFITVKTELKNQITKQEKRLNMIENKSTYRPILSTTTTSDAPHKKAFTAYLRFGDEEVMRTVQIEEKSLSTAVLGDGGYLVDSQTTEQIMGILRNASSIRSIANVVNVEASAYDVFIDTADIGAAWASETQVVSETTTPSLKRIKIPLHELSALPKASQRLLDDSAFDVENWLAIRIADKFLRAEAAAFISGDGMDKPKGIISYNTIDNSRWIWGKLGYVATGVNGDFNSSKPADAIVDLIYALGARYRANATFVMNSKTAGAVRKMKDTDGRFLWSDGLAVAEPARLMGYPVLLAEDMPDIAANALAVAFGDFNAGYTIAERPDLRIQRDPFTAKPNVVFYATKRVGGDVSDFSAVKLLKFSQS